MEYILMVGFSTPTERCEAARLRRRGAVRSKEFAKERRKEFARRKEFVESLSFEFEGVQVRTINLASEKTERDLFLPFSRLILSRFFVLVTLFNDL